jgi:hypothetical protein
MLPASDDAHNGWSDITVAFSTSSTAGDGEH